MALEMFYVKIIGACVAAVITFSAGFLPRIQALRMNPLLLELLNMFGGGVFLAVALMDLLPEMQEGFEDFYEDHHSHLRLGDVLVIAGYSLMLFLEKVAFKHDHAFHHHLHGEKEAAGGHGHGHAQASERKSVNNEVTKESEKKPDETTVLLPTTDAHQSEKELKREKNRTSALVTVLLLLGAMSIHGFFEGLVVGTLSEGLDSLTVVLAIVSHKPLESLSLGTIMVRGDIGFKTYIALITAVSLFTPAGIAVGMIIESEEATGLTIPILYAIAVGCFLYIATTEIVAEEISHIKKRIHGVYKYMAFILGIVFIGLINGLVPYS